MTNPNLPPEILTALETIIRSRRDADPTQSYVAGLLAGEVDGVLKKIGEEATEVVIAGKDGDAEALIYESADLIFHLLVLLGRENIPFAAVLAELSRRFGISGLAEKAARHH